MATFQVKLHPYYCSLALTNGAPLKEFVYIDALWDCLKCEDAENALQHILRQFGVKFVVHEGGPDEECITRKAEAKDLQEFCERTYLSSETVFTNREIAELYTLRSAIEATLF